jgi:hypothetical protein
MAKIAIEREGAINGRHGKENHYTSLLQEIKFLARTFR